MRLIDADALIKELDENEDVGGWYLAKADIEAAPTVDAVPVVRCRECVHFDNRFHECRRTMWSCKDDDFCSYGER